MVSCCRAAPACGRGVTPRELANRRGGVAQTIANVHVATPPRFATRGRSAGPFGRRLRRNATAGHYPLPQPPRIGSDEHDATFLSRPGRAGPAARWAGVPLPQAPLAGLAAAPSAAVQ